jgi:hypothetical protein
MPRNAGDAGDARDGGDVRDVRDVGDVIAGAKVTMGTSSLQMRA